MSKKDGKAKSSYRFRTYGFGRRTPASDTAKKSSAKKKRTRA